MSDFSIIGKRIALVDSAGKTTGQGKYTDDLSVPGMLTGKILHSPYPHARIKKIDTSKAEVIDGVVCVVTGPDAPSKPTTYLAGMAKLRFCPLRKVANATPTTPPCPLRTGPPLLPGEMGAVIWRSSPVSTTPSVARLRVVLRVTACPLPPVTVGTVRVVFALFTASVALPERGL